MGSMNAARSSSQAESRPAREKLLDVASELFYQHGIRAVGIDTIIAQAGVAKASLYNHFSSKDELVVAWLQRMDAFRSAALVGAMTRKSTKPLDQLYAFFDGLLEWFSSEGFRGCAFLNTLAEISDVNHPARAQVLGNRTRLREMLEKLAREAGLHNPGELASQLVLITDGAVIYASMHRDPKGAATLARNLGEPLLDAAQRRGKKR
jgi:AcrR family transcriptional regulator